MKGELRAFETGTYQSGTYTQVAGTEEAAKNVVMEPGIIYETRLQFSSPVSVDLTQAILAIQSAVGMVKVTYMKVDGNTLIYQAMIPTGQSVGLVPILVWTVIAAVIAIVAIELIAVFVFRVDIFKFEDIAKIIPGMIVTMAGAVVTSVLPGKTKVAGLVPLGIGAYMMLQPFVPGGGGGGGGEVKHDIRFTIGPEYPSSAMTNDKITLKIQIFNFEKEDLNYYSQLVNKDTNQVVADTIKSGPIESEKPVNFYQYLTMPSNDFNLRWEVGTVSDTKVFTVSDTRNMTIKNSGTPLPTITSIRAAKV
jgi:hypothetical protein